MAAESPGWGSLLGMGVAIAATLGVGLAVGWFIDSRAHTSPVFVIVGLALGIVGGVGYTVSQFKQYLTGPDHPGPKQSDTKAE